MTTDVFWEQLWVWCGDKYLSQTTKPSYSDFMVWAEDNNLVPEMEDYDG